MFGKNLKSKPIVKVMILTIVISMVVVLVAGCCREPRQALVKGSVVRAVVVTGGHDYEKEPFFEMFDVFENISYVHYEIRDDSEIFEDISNWDYDVIVLYNMTQKISEKRQENFKKLLKEKSVGLVAVHHSIANFQNWDEYRKIIGGKYFLEDTVIDGVQYKRGAWQDNVKMNIHIEDKKHPVTKGLSNFEILDETYKNFVVDEGNKILLTTDEPRNEKQVCWVRRYGEARVCYIQFGNGRSAYENENYRKLVSQAIIWSAGEIKN